MAAPIGNTNATKNKPFAEALRSAMVKFARDEDWIAKARDKPIPAVIRGTALEVIAERLVAHAVCGDIDAIDMIANRLDGKPRQEMELSGHVALSQMSDDDLRREVQRGIAAVEDADDLV